MNELTKDKLALLFPANREKIRAYEIKGLTFKGIDLSQCDFSDVYFDHVCFDKSMFNQSIFTRAFFNDCHLADCDFSNSVFPDAAFKGGSIILNCKFDSCYLTRTLFNAIINDTSFIRASFIGANMLGCERLKGCSFNDCDLTGASYASQEKLKRLFLKSSNGIFWRVRNGITNKSLLGKKIEKAGDIIEISDYDVSMDFRDGCASGLHICLTKTGAEEFSKDHYEKGCGLVYRVKINPENLLCVHLSGDFGRVNKYLVL